MSIYFQQIEVMSIARESSSNEWSVHYKRLVNGMFELAEETIRARHVILGAGALGSTKILLRSKERGLNISPTIGTRFSTNGDMLTFSYDGAKETNSIGVQTKDLIGPHKKVAPGPCVTSVMDLRKQDGKLVDNFVIEEGTPPSSMGRIYSIGLTVAGKVSCVKTDNSHYRLILKLGKEMQINHHS
jgi:cholesterol oxidase